MRVAASPPTSQRLFFAVPLPAETRPSLIALQQRLAGSGVGVKWVAAANLHLTLRFLGDQPSSGSETLSELARQVAAAHRPCQVALQGVGAFPSGRSPRTLWVGVGAGREALGALAGDLSAALEAAGVVATEGRPWAGHCTVGRVRQSGGLGPLTEALATASLTTAPWTVNEFVLYASRLTAAGPVYHSVQAFALGQSAC
jgi:2'-5' RNA ligase